MADLIYFNRHYDRFSNACDINQLQTHYKIPIRKNEKKNI